MIDFAKLFRIYFLPKLSAIIVTYLFAFVLKDGDMRILQFIIMEEDIVVTFVLRQLGTTMGLFRAKF